MKGLQSSSNGRYARCVEEIRRLKFFSRINNETCVGRLHVQSNFYANFNSLERKRERDKVKNDRYYNLVIILFTLVVLLLGSLQGIVRFDVKIGRLDVFRGIVNLVHRRRIVELDGLLDLDRIIGNLLRDNANGLVLLVTLKVLVFTIDTRLISVDEFFIYSCYTLYIVCVYCRGLRLVVVYQAGLIGVHQSDSDLQGIQHNR